MEAIKKDIELIKYSLFGSNTVGIMKTDGTPEGTRPVRGLYNGSSDFMEYSTVVAWNGKLYFSFFDLDQFHQLLWESDGTQDGTRLIYDQQAQAYFAPSNVSGTEQELVFTSASSTGGTALIALNPLTKETRELYDFADRPRKSPISPKGWTR